MRCAPPCLWGGAVSSAGDGARPGCVPGTPIGVAGVLSRFRRTNRARCAPKDYWLGDCQLIFYVCPDDNQDMREICSRASSQKVYDACGSWLALQFYVSADSFVSKCFLSVCLVLHAASMLDESVPHRCSLLCSSWRGAFAARECVTAAPLWAAFSSESSFFTFSSSMRRSAIWEVLTWM